MKPQHIVGGPAQDDKCRPALPDNGEGKITIAFTPISRIVGTPVYAGLRMGVDRGEGGISECLGEQFVLLTQ